LKENLEGLTHRNVRIGSLHTSLPLNIYVKDIDIEGLLKIKEVSCGGVFFDIFRQNFVIDRLKLKNPTLVIEKAVSTVSPEGTPKPAASISKNNVKDVSSTQTPDPTTASPSKFMSARLCINHLVISDGAINFIDNITPTDKITIQVEDIEVRIDNLNFGSRSPKITSFKISGKIPWSKDAEKGTIEADGWIDIYKKDMQANLKIRDIDGVYLFPYYSGWVNLEKARIQKVKLNFTSNINSLNNDVTAQCRLELTDIVFKPRPPEEGESKTEKVASAVLGIFKALNQDKVALDFTFKTKMDSPKFGFGAIKSAIEDTIARGKRSDTTVQEVVMFPAKVMEGTVKGATDMSKAVIGGVASIGNELKNALISVFKKDKEEK